MMKSKLQQKSNTTNRVKENGRLGQSINDVVAKY